MQAQAAQRARPPAFGPPRRASHRDEEDDLSPSPRYFLAIEATEGGKAALASYLSGLRPLLAAARPVWVRPELFHLTLYFFGTASPDFPGRLAGRLGPIAAAAQRPSLASGGLRLLGGAPGPRVLCLDFGLKPSRAFDPLLAEARALAAETGTHLETRPWLAHLSLARLKAPACPPLPSLPRPPALLLSPDSCTLFASTLGPGGPSYAKLAEFPFSGGAA